MRGWRTAGSLWLAAAVALGALLSLVLTSPALAQPAPASAELKRVIGRVEILRKGQTQWVPAVIGARLVEGDDIRAFSGAQAELALPEAQRPHDGALDGVGGGHELLEEVGLEPHVGVEPEHPGRVALQEVADGLVAAGDELPGVALHRDQPATADPLVGAEVGEE